MAIVINEMVEKHDNLTMFIAFVTFYSRLVLKIPNLFLVSSILIEPPRHRASKCRFTMLLLHEDILIHVG